MFQKILNWFKGFFKRKKPQQKRYIFTSGLQQKKPILDEKLVPMIEEYNRIKEKKSDLSRAERDKITGLIDQWIQLGVLPHYYYAQLNRE